MIYVYDKVMEPYENSFRRYGALYKLERRFKMKDQMFHSYVSPGREKILVVPEFARQYKEVEAICNRHLTGKRLETCISQIKRYLNKRLIVEEFPNSDSSTGIMHVIEVIYRDICVVFEFMDGALTLTNEFEIIDNNLFGNGIVVTMNMDMEEE